MLPGYTRKVMRLRNLGMAVALCLLFLPVASFAASNSDCFGCHTEKEMTAEDASLKEGGPAKPQRDVARNQLIPRFQVTEEAFNASVHGKLSCTDCHKDIKDLPHTKALAPVNCAGCHADAADKVSKSRHVVLHNKTNPANAPRCADCHGAHDIKSVSDDASPVAVKNVSNTCMRCHGQTELAERAGISIPGAGRMFSASVHYKALQKGDSSAPSCVSCHGSHDVKDRLDPASPIFRSNIPATCGQCHDSAAAEFKESTHGAAFDRGAPDAPSCTDCHGDHDIRPKTDPDSTLSFANITTKTCPSCHAADRLAKRYGVPVEKVQGYYKSFHGLSAGIGDERVASCVDCHGGHKIFPSSDVRSATNPQNLAKTCGTQNCHPGATANFGVGNVHVDAGGAGAVIKKYVKIIYFFLIVGTIGGMFGHNLLDFIRKMKIRYAQRKNAKGMYERLNKSERIQHAMTFTSFILLVITGFALYFKWTLPFVSDRANALARSYTHRAAAILMIVGSVYHVIYILTTERGRKQFFQMLPTLKDARDIVDNMKFYLGFADHGPRFLRFSYIEKAEYLALLWGTVVMIVTGFMLWFETDTLKHLPFWAFDVATMIHLYEAILATLAIIVWHFYYVFINPDFAPMAFTWIDGNLTREQMAHEHPLELEEIEGKPCCHDGHNEKNNVH